MADKTKKKASLPENLTESEPQLKQPPFRQVIEPGRSADLGKGGRGQGAGGSESGAQSNNPCSQVRSANRQSADLGDRVETQ
ncbi:hypothetical protein CEXT_116631 [Caerostris extrusa]|uniref:Uncharacterized protein n=1 Tax=Caerostris extrusa TaxID=172846 RepID=A0AAV4PLC9_CAEEX|nr:hypothetical protein CEXT_116631 [Caerostris extrusa]